MSLSKTNLRALRLAANEAWTAGRRVYVTICNSAAASTCEWKQFQHDHLV